MNVAMFGAGVARRDGGFGPNFDHMALMVTLEDRWLADVGFGESFVEPQYRFTLQPYEFADYEGMCRFHQTSPESHFTNNEQPLSTQAEYDRLLRDSSASSYSRG